MPKKPQIQAVGGAATDTRRFIFGFRTISENYMSIWRIVKAIAGGKQNQFTAWAQSDLVTRLG